MGPPLLRLAQSEFPNLSNTLGLLRDGSRNFICLETGPNRLTGETPRSCRFVSASSGRKIHPSQEVLSKHFDTLSLHF